MSPSASTTYFQKEVIRHLRGILSAWEEWLKQK